ncbi:hypothetical protein VCHA53O466_50494 [Vibrio chagasii]|nr:hypothetical protein VCHA53O466_50494 [Vibrio chagasii]
MNLEKYTKPVLLSLVVGACLIIINNGGNRFKQIAYSSIEIMGSDGTTSDVQGGFIGKWVKVCGSDSTVVSKGGGRFESICEVDGVSQAIEVESHTEGALKIKSIEVAGQSTVSVKRHEKVRNTVFASVIIDVEDILAEVMNNVDNMAPVEG